MELILIIAAGVILGGVILANLDAVVTGALWVFLFIVVILVAWNVLGAEDWLERLTAVAFVIAIGVGTVEFLNDTDEPSR